jgi:transcriptional regulator of acetoin/glycerol metabolism
LDGKELPPEVVSHQNDTNVSVSFNSVGETSTSSFQNSSPANLRDAERLQILNALEQTGWHRGKTAELLGISPSTLYRRLREYDLDIR